MSAGTEAIDRARPPEGHDRQPLPPAGAPGHRRKNVYTFVPGNLTELLLSFDLLPVLPEINAIQAGMRQESGDYVLKAEKLGHAEDVCAYVKCSIGALHSGHIGPTGERLPDPDLLLLSYTGCFTFMKWFELLREETKAKSVMMHVPYQADGRITPSMRDYVVKQLKVVIPAGSPAKYDGEKLRPPPVGRGGGGPGLGAQSAKHTPSSIDAYFGATSADLLVVPRDR
jgi:benzoyl-CoA reductase subunit B